MKHYAFFFALLLAGCNVTSRTYVSTSNPEVPLMVVFVHDGCTMYRFNDGGSIRYFAHCKDGSAEVGSTEMINKVQVPVTIQTVRTK
jgi:hypothetical protein